MDTALIVIDVQESFRQRPDWTGTAELGIVDRVRRLVAAARAGGDLVVWVLHSEPGSGGVFDPRSGHVRLQDGLTPLDAEPVVVKTSVNAFTTTGLQQLLTTNGVRNLVVCGIRTEQCCETTARIASDLGYEVTFVTDATTTSAIPAGAGAPGLSADEIRRRTELVLAARGFATIATTDEVVARRTALAV